MQQEEDIRLLACRAAGVTRQGTPVIVLPQLLDTTGQKKVKEICDIRVTYTFLLVSLSASRIKIRNHQTFGKEWG